MEITLSETEGQVVFESWREFVNYADTTLSDMPEDKRQSRELGKMECDSPLTPYWHGASKTWEEAVQLAKGGWMEGSRAIESQFLELVLPVEDTKMESVFSVTGPGTLALGRYVEGHPKSWLTRRRTPITTGAENTRGVIKMAVNISQSAVVSAYSRFQVGAAILALIETLERNYRRVELMFCNAIRGGRVGSIRVGTVVKRADEPFNLATLAYAFANTATQRRLCFSVRESLPLSVRRPCGVVPGGGYGSTDSRWIPDGYQGIPGLGNVNLTDKESVGDWVKQTVAQLGRGE